MINLIKANSIKEYKILEFIEANFDLDSIDIVREHGCLKVIDEKGDFLYFWIEGEKVIFNDLPF